ncbi:MAG: aminopeptidase P family protein [Chloroflexi bacterium]|nr:aminopeptidase P family protein [Chloroflexota bacterium]
MINVTRLEHTRQRMAERGLTYLCVVQPANRRYLADFAAHDDSPGGAAAWLIVRPDGSTLVTNFLYYEAVRHSVTTSQVVCARQTVTDEVIELLLALAPGRVGVEGNYLTHDLFQQLAEKLKERHELVTASGLVEQLRAVKDDQEIATIARAVELTDRAYEHAVGVVRPGMSERALAWEIERFMREHGAEGMAFPPIVASGPNGAIPHHQISDRPIPMGEPVLIDIGAKVDGYCGDLTRTFCLGRRDPRFDEVAAIVRRALDMAEAGIHPGLTGKEADALARDVIDAAGYKEAFGHGLGHGVGLEIHEAPRVSFRAPEERLAPGMVITIEPGIYLSGWGGVRIEDLAVVTETGLRVLTRAPHPLYP